MEPLRIPKSVVTFGEAIRWCRESRRMTLRQLSTAVGVSPPFQSDLEHGRRETSRVADYARVLHVDVADLEARQGVTEDLIEWLKRNPGVTALLRSIRGCRCHPLILKQIKKPMVG